MADFEELFNLAKRDEGGEERTVLPPQNEMPQDLPQQLEISLVMNDVRWFFIEKMPHFPLKRAKRVDLKIVFSKNLEF